MRRQAKNGLRQVKYPFGDKIAFSLGIIITLLTIAFFIWKMQGNLEKDRSLKAVPANTPTPPLKSKEK